jgi:hypothetical protein
MAKIVFGMAIPHSGMLGQPPDVWLTNGERDRRNPQLWYRNRTWTYPQLEAERSGEGLERFLTMAERAQRSARCFAAIDVMRAAYEAARIDVAIILGKDQQEIFTHFSPSIAIYTGAEIYNGPPQRSVYAPDHPVVHAGYPSLAAHLIRSLAAEGFDLTDLFRWPDNVWMKPLPDKPIVPHAYGYVYRQVMRDEPPRNVPILLNCFYPPTQPSMSRCIELGRALYRALAAWPTEERVAIIASGGLSHFVCDEAFDQKIMGHLRDFDFEALAAVDDRSYQSGTSEIKLYATMMISMREIGARMTLVDYVPCYRTSAGTGEGMGFFHFTLPKDDSP